MQLDTESKGADSIIYSTDAMFFFFYRSLALRVNVRLGSTSRHEESPFKKHKDPPKVHPWRWSGQLDEWARPFFLHLAKLHPYPEGNSGASVRGTGGFVPIKADRWCTDQICSALQAQTEINWKLCLAFTFRSIKHMHSTRSLWIK